MYSIIGWDTVIGSWTRIEGIPNQPTAKRQGGITVLGTGVTVDSELSVRGCVVLDHKGISSSQSNAILL